MANDNINLFDRIKEISHDTGTGNFKVEGAATGFSSFGDSYAYNDAIFYAITDGTDYEVGSGNYILDGSDNAVTRFPFKSSNGDALVNFTTGVKEVFVTYPGKFAVFTASGIGNFDEPKDSGVAFWGGKQTLDYDPNFVWNDSTDRLGILHTDPQYTIDIGGDNNQSTIKVSGLIIGDSGIMFSGVADSGGRQIEPFLRTELDNETGTDAVFSLSGIVGERLLFQQQVKGTVFAGPVSGCIGGCSPDYPTFRYLTSGDIPDLSEAYTKQFNDGSAGEVAVYKSSGVYQFDPNFVWNVSTNTLALDGELNVSGLSTISGITTLGSDLITYSGGTNGTANTVINDSGFLRIPIIDTVPNVISEFPASIDTSGVIMLGGSHLMVCNGTAWVSGLFV